MALRPNLTGRHLSGERIRRVVPLLLLEQLPYSSSRTSRSPEAEPRHSASLPFSRSYYGFVSADSVTLSTPNPARLVQRYKSSFGPKSATFPVLCLPTYLRYSRNPGSGATIRRSRRRLTAPKLGKPKKPRKPRKSTATKKTVRTRMITIQMPWRRMIEVRC